jgi:hypothetical protein
VIVNGTEIGRVARARGVFNLGMAHTLTGRWRGQRRPLTVR